MLYEIQPSVAIIEKYGEVSSKNEAFTNAVIHNNPLKTVEDIRVTSSKMASLEKEGKIKIVGAIYKMAAWKVEFIQ